MEATCSSETSLIRRTTWCYIPENTNLHNHRCKNLEVLQVTQKLTIKNLLFCISYYYTLGFSIVSGHQQLMYTDQQYIYIYTYCKYKFGKMWTRMKCVKYNQNDQVKEDEMGRACSKCGKKWNPYRIFVVKRRWKDNIKTNHSMTWTGLIWLRIGTDRMLLWTRQGTFGYHKMLEILE
jgi:hypothetical protein